MLVTNLYFSSIIQHSCVENKCSRPSSCPWIVSEFASHHSPVLLLCSKICGHCVHTKHEKVSAGKSLAPLKAGHVLTPVVWCPTVWCIHFLCFCEWRYSCGGDKQLCSFQCWSCANTCNVCWCITNHFLCSCVCDMDHESVIKYHYYYIIIIIIWNWHAHCECGEGEAYISCVQIP